MSKRIIVLDTSVICVWLKVPGKETCGSGKNELNYDSVNKFIEEEIKNNATLLLPLATIIEVGNHITQSSGDKFQLANQFKDIIFKTIENETPWALFTLKSESWEGVKLKKLTEEWVKSVDTLSFGDISIVDVANYYASTGGYEVFIYTGDKGLEAYSPQKPIIIPRRRK